MKDALEEAATEIERLNAEVLEQCRINGMSAEREDSLRAEIKRLKAAQPAPVKTYHAFEPLPVAPVPNGPYSAPIKELWPVAPKPWVGLTDEEAQWIYDNGRTPAGMMEMVEAKLKEKNT
jgi:hypothetical protein